MTVSALGLGAALIPLSPTVVHAAEPSSFPVSVSDPFSHEEEYVEQLDPVTGEWVKQPIWKGICIDRPARLVAPEVPVDSENMTAFNYRLEIGGRTLPASSASEVVTDFRAFGVGDGALIQFTYLADAARGSTVRLNFSSGGTPGTIPLYMLHAFC